MLSNAFSICKTFSSQKAAIRLSSSLVIPSSFKASSTADLSSGASVLNNVFSLFFRSLPFKVCAIPLNISM